MSLQRRLTLYFVIIVVLPLAAAGFLVQRLVVGEISSRAVEALDPELDSAVLVYNGRASLLDEAVKTAVNDPQTVAVLQGTSSTDPGAYLTRALHRISGIDFLVLLDPDGKVIASAERPGDFAPGFKAPSATSIATGGDPIGPGFRASPAIPVRVSNVGDIGRVVGGFWLDGGLIGAAQSSDVELSVVSDGNVVASTADLRSSPAVPLDFQDSFDVDLGGRSKATARSLGDGIALMASTRLAPIESRSRLVVLSLAALLAVALVGAAVLAFLLARLITLPLNELAQGSRAIAQGKYGHRIPVRGRDEVGQLATAFNDMSQQLETTVGQLSTSRDQLRQAVQRVGDALRGTHDFSKMLETVLETSADAVGADVAVLWRVSPARDELYPALSRGIESTDLNRIAMGEGVVGSVAESGTAVILPQMGAAQIADVEPRFPTTMALPMRSDDKVTGVLAAYRSDPSKIFTDEDVETAMFLTEQGSVAIENVLLHDEARRLSLTDGLTSIWNMRFFQMQFRQVLATSTRFARSFSILMLDLDRFKGVNDTYGHQRGDEILIEFAQRVSRTLREVDTFARYGGEEFICLLSETDKHGAFTTAEKILFAIRALPFGGSNGEAPVELTVSIGIASYPEHGDSFQALVRRADEALYRAKQEGRDRIYVTGDTRTYPAGGLG
ncbi:MAG: diguanylate cyclase [Actinomycetota bacterium]